MKIILLVLIFCLFINSTSAFLWFNHRSTEQLKQITQSSSTQDHHSTPQFQRSTFQEKQWRNATSPLLRNIISSSKNNANTSPLQRIINQQQYKVLYTAAVQRQADSINKKSSPIIPQNRFQAIAYQQQHRSLNNPLSYPQTNRINSNTNSPMAYRRLRPFLSTDKNNMAVVNSVNRRIFPATSLTKSVAADSKPNTLPNIKNNIQPFQPRSAPLKAIIANTKPGLLQALSTRAINNNNNNQVRQRLIADYYYQQRLKEFYQRINEEHAARIHSNMNIPLRQRKREYDDKLVPSNNYIGMVLVRDSNIRERDTN